MKNKKHAYTLAEIMVVILVLTVIFAAFAPVFTRRRVTNTSSKFNVWQYYDLTTRDAYADSGNTTNSGELFIGVTPEAKDEISTTFAPKSKVIIRASESVTSEAKKQHQIMFRYGYPSSGSTTPKGGDFAGTWLMDGKNVLMGSTFNELVNDGATPAMGNTAIGYAALSHVVRGKNNTAIGYHTLNKITNQKSNTAIGYYALESNTGNSNTAVGALAGNVTAGSQNVAVGYNAGLASGSNNTYIGAFAGKSGSGNENTALGYNALPVLTNAGTHNIAIGYNALGKLTNGSNNVAIGYNACSELTNSSNKTCIGANSGPHAGTTAENYLNVRDNGDTQQRTYIGSKPKGGFPGDAVIEIHNINTSNHGIMNRFPGANVKTSNTTTIINGNLIVMGRPYFTVSSTLHHFHDQNKINSNNDRVYGYSQTTDTYYAKCATDSDNYAFSSTKCVNLNPSDSSVFSDRRLKNIGSANTAGLAQLRKINVFNYNFKNDPKKTPHVGVMAQDLAHIFPNSVFKGSDGYLRIKWDEMFFAAINAVKELDRKLVALVKRTTNVETQITQLENENITLKNQVADLTARVNKLKAQ